MFLNAFIAQAPWSVAVVLGLWLAAGDWAAIETFKRNGRSRGLALWLVVVAAPLVGCMALSLKVALGAAVVAIVVSGLAYVMYKHDTRFDAPCRGA